MRPKLRARRASKMAAYPGRSESYQAVAASVAKRLVEAPSARSELWPATDLALQGLMFYRMLRGGEAAASCWSDLSRESDVTERNSAHPVLQDEPIRGGCRHLRFSAEHGVS